MAQFIVKWARLAGTPKTPKVKWLSYTFDVIQIRELPESSFGNYKFDNAEMVVESYEEFSEYILESLLSGRVYVAEV
jgi:hypothetical protein